MTHLSLHQLSVCQGDNTVVEPLSVDLSVGESITILGETGSGKSLFSKAILGDLPNGFTAQGDIVLGGETISTLSSVARQSLWGNHIGFIPQEPRQSLNPLMQASQQVSEVHRHVLNRSANDAQSLTEHAFQALGLATHRNKYPVELSGGMAQRSAFLAASAAGAKVLIADEPTKGLDATSKRHVIEQLLAHKQQGIVITITHDLEVANALGGKLYLLLHGQWLIQGETFETLAQQSHHPYVDQLFQATPYKTRSQAEKKGQAVVHANAVSMRYQRQTLFDAISFSLHEGEVIGISGASGCGKSTLCDLLLGLKRPTRGSIEYPTSLAAGKKLKLYQDPPQSFSAQFTLHSQLSDVCQLHGIDPRLIDEYAHQLKIKREVLSRYPEQVSGGELQRVAILRVLLLKPKLLIADEPTTRLDPNIARETMGLLMESVAEIGCGMILVSHDEQELLAYCDRLITFTDQGIVTRQL